MVAVHECCLKVTRISSACVTMNYSQSHVFIAKHQKLSLLISMVHHQFRLSQDHRAIERNGASCPAPALTAHPPLQNPASTLPKSAPRCEPDVPLLHDREPPLPCLPPTTQLPEKDGSQRGFCFR